MLGALVVQLAPGGAHQRDERPWIQVALRILGATAQRGIGKIGHGVRRAEAFELLGRVFQFCHGEHRGVANTGRVVGGKVQAAVCSLQRHAVAAANEGARRKGGEPAQIGATRQIAGGFALVRVLRRGNLERQVVLDFITLRDH